MPAKPKRKALPKPSVFKLQDRWVCEYYSFDQTGRPKVHRKSFIRELKRGGGDASVSEQRTAALTFRDSLLKDMRAQERMERREREQPYLSLKELKEAKAAFAIFNQIPDRNKSLVDAVILYRENLKLVVDTPELRVCVAIFLKRKKDAAEDALISKETYRTLNQRLGNMLSWFEKKKLATIKLGQVTAAMLVEYLEQMKISARTRRNYINDMSNFFNDVSDPRDKNRFLHENPMDGVYIHYKKSSQSRALKTDRNARSAPVVLQFKRTKHTLKVAYEMREHGMLGFTVAGLFLGMRPSELYDMVKTENFWQKCIKLEEGIVRIDGFGKKRDQRNILMSEACKAWLIFIRDNNLPFCFERKKNGQNLHYAAFRAKAYLPEAGMAERLTKIRKLYKTGKKPTAEEKAFMEHCNEILQRHEDVLRHTFGTNFYYESGFDKNKTIEQMGHSGEVFVEHYRGLLDSPDSWTGISTLLPSEFSP